MESSRVFLLLIGICCVGLVRQAHSQCCTLRAFITFKMDKGRCYMVGAKSLGYGACKVDVCADGTAAKGRFCGKCDKFGCNCVGECRTGDYEHSFLEKYQKHGITIFESYHATYE